MDDGNYSNGGKIFSHGGHITAEDLQPWGHITAEDLQPWGHITAEDLQPWGHITAEDLQPWGHITAEDLQPWGHITADLNVTACRTAIRVFRSCLSDIKDAIHLCAIYKETRDYGK